MFEEELGGILHRCGRLDRDYGEAHEIPGFDGSPSFLNAPKLLPVRAHAAPGPEIKKYYFLRPSSGGSFNFDLLLGFDCFCLLGKRHCKHTLFEVRLDLLDVDAFWNYEATFK
jgi:hypothetical protein